MVINNIYEGRVLRIAVGILAIILLVGGASAVTFPIGYGETKSEYINSTAEMDSYTFMANAGDRILIRMDSSWINGPEIRLYAPNGSLIYLAPGYSLSKSGYFTHVSEITTQSLPDSGSYTILAGDNAGDNTGKYALYLQRLNNPGNVTPFPTLISTPIQSINYTILDINKTSATAPEIKDIIIKKLANDILFLNGSALSISGQGIKMITVNGNYVDTKNFYVNVTNEKIISIVAMDNDGNITTENISLTTPIPCTTYITILLAVVAILVGLFRVQILKILGIKYKEREKDPGEGERIIEK